MDCQRLLVLSIALAALCSAVSGSRQLQQTSTDSSTTVTFENGTITGKGGPRLGCDEVPEAGVAPLPPRVADRAAVLLLQARPSFWKETSSQRKTTGEPAMPANFRTGHCSCCTGSGRRRRSKLQACAAPQASLRPALPALPPCCQPLSAHLLTIHRVSLSIT